MKTYPVMFLSLKIHTCYMEKNWMTTNLWMDNWSFDKLNIFQIRGPSHSLWFRRKCTGWYNWILLRKLKYFICCLRDVFLFLVWHLSNSIWPISIYGVKSSWTSLYSHCCSLHWLHKSSIGHCCLFWSKVDRPRNPLGRAVRKSQFRQWLGFCSAE